MEKAKRNFDEKLQLINKIQTSLVPRKKPTPFLTIECTQMALPPLSGPTQSTILSTVNGNDMTKEECVVGVSKPIRKKSDLEIMLSGKIYKRSEEMINKIIFASPLVGRIGLNRTAFRMSHYSTMDSGHNAIMNNSHSKPRSSLSHQLSQPKKASPLQLNLSPIKLISQRQHDNVLASFYRQHNKHMTERFAEKSYERFGEKSYSNVLDMNPQYIIEKRRKEKSKNRRKEGTDRYSPWNKEEGDIWDELPKH